MSVADVEAEIAGKLTEFGGLGATLKFDFGDDQLFVDGTKKPAVLSHDDEEADCTLVVSSDNLLKIVGGELDATMAFMTGKLKVKGNTAIAMKLAGVLKG